MKTCLISSDKDVAQVSGTFVDGVLQGRIEVVFKNSSVLVGYAVDGHLCGIYKEFNEQLRLQAIYKDFERLWKRDEHNNASMKYPLGNDAIYIVENPSEAGILCQGSKARYYFTNCRNVLREIRIPSDVVDLRKVSDAFVTDQSEPFALNLITMSRAPLNTEQNEHCSNQDWNSENTAARIEEWLQRVSEKNYDPEWYKPIDFNPIDPQTRKVSITFPMFVNRTNDNHYIIKNHFGLLKSGIMVNGTIKFKLSTYDDIEDWKGPLQVMFDKHVDYELHVSHEEGFDIHEKVALIRLKNGKLNGLIRTFGRLPNDPRMRCTKRCFQNGLSFYGYYDEGKPVGHSWKRVDRS